MACRRKRKLFTNNHLNARGGLEPDFRVLVSTLFHPHCPGKLPLGWKIVESSGSKRVASLRTRFFCVSV